jgi:hypothetical protein
MRLIALALLLSASAFAEEPISLKGHGQDMERPPLGTWGVNYCSGDTVIWVTDANGLIYRYDHSNKPPAKAMPMFNNWINSGPTDIVEEACARK